jgi:hypothetical protein
VRSLVRSPSLGPWSLDCRRMKLENRLLGRPFFKTGSFSKIMSKGFLYVGATAGRLRSNSNIGLRGNANGQEIYTQAHLLPNYAHFPLHQVVYLSIRRSFRRAFCVSVGVTYAACAALVVLRPGGYFTMILSLR